MTNISSIVKLLRNLAKRLLTNDCSNRLRYLKFHDVP
jgi:hypothetical protein